MPFARPVFVGEIKDAEIPKPDKYLIAVVIGKLAFDSNLDPLIK